MNQQESAPKKQKKSALQMLQNGTLQLKHPLTFGKTPIASLTFRTYTTAADYLAFDRRGGVAQRIALIASLTGTDEAIIQQLRGPDYRAAERIADELMEADELADEPGQPGDDEDAGAGVSEEKKPE